MRPWCDVSLRVASTEWSTRQIAAALTLAADPDPSGRNAIWTRSFAGENMLSCETQLDGLAEFLASQANKFTELPDHCSVDVLVGWSPAPGEDHMYLAPGLIRHLAAVNAMLHIDTYTTGHMTDR